MLRHCGGPHTMPRISCMHTPRSKLHRAAGVVGSYASCLRGGRSLTISTSTCRRPHVRPAWPSELPRIPAMALPCPSGKELVAASGGMPLRDPLKHESAVRRGESRRV